MEKGFIKLNRKFFSNEMWEAARTFSECEAWLDLIQSARFEAADKIECIGGREITYGRGQYPASIRFLAKRWRWGEQKVKTFLAKLKKKEMITTDDSQGMNVITLSKYDEYNSNITANNPHDNPPKTLSVTEIQRLITQTVAQQITQCQPSGNPNSKKEEEREEYNTPPIIPPGGYEDFDFNFASSEYWETFITWLDYKKGRREKYKTQKSLELCYKTLVKFSGNAENAKKVVEQSMANNWAGLFELKSLKNGKSSKTNDVDPGTPIIRSSAWGGDNGQ